MLRVPLSHASWSLTSFTPRFPSSSVSSFHTAAILHAAGRNSSSNKKRNLKHTQERIIKQAENRPSVVLGTRTREEDVIWRNCDLAKCLVNPHDLNGPPALPSSTSTTSRSSSTSLSTLTETIRIPELDTTVTIPKNANYGIDAPEKQMLFQRLSVLTAKSPEIVSESHFKAAFDEVKEDEDDSSSDTDEAKKDDPSFATDQLEQVHESGSLALEKEQRKMDAFAKVIDIRNANAGGIAYENRRRIVLEFSGPENPYDPGRTEVQAALLTYKIRNLWNHLTTFKRDVGNRRSLLKLIHQRAKILRYLKRQDQDRYEAVLPRLALDSKSIEGELTL